MRTNPFSITPRLSQRAAKRSGIADAAKRGPRSPRRSPVMAGCVPSLANSTPRRRLMDRLDDRYRRRQPADGSRRRRAGRGSPPDRSAGSTAPLVARRKCPPVRVTSRAEANIHIPTGRSHRSVPDRRSVRQPAMLKTVIQDKTSLPIPRRRSAPAPIVPCKCGTSG